MQLPIRSSDGGRLTAESSPDEIRDDRERGAGEGGWIVGGNKAGREGSFRTELLNLKSIHSSQ